MGRFRPVLSLTLVGALSLAACGRSDYEYVSNRSERVYFKIPRNWSVFDAKALLDKEPAGGWVRGFAAAGDAKPEQVFSIDSPFPRGYAYVLPLSDAARDTLSFATLRSTNFGTDAQGNAVDPLAYVAANPDGGLTIETYEELNRDHVRGIHIRLRLDDGGVTEVVDQTVMVDSRTSRTYLLTLGCRLTCWQAHEKEMKEVIASWTVKDRR
jgi:hypothetical protein